MGSGAGDQLQVGARVRPVLGVLDSLRSLLDELDPGQLPARDAMDLVTVLDRVGRVADAGKMAAALRVAESSLWKRTGARSAADHLAKVTGVGVGDAVRALKTAAVVAHAPETRDALARGEVSPSQAAAVAEVEKLSPEKGRQLLADAKKKSAKELETEAAQIVAAASPETDAEKAERHHRARRLAVGTGLDGMGWGSWKLPPAAHARLVAQFRPPRSRSSPSTVAATRRTPPPTWPTPSWRWATAPNTPRERIRQHRRRSDHRPRDHRPCRRRRRRRCPGGRGLVVRQGHRAGRRRRPGPRRACS